MSKGKALDIQESGPILGFNSVVTGTSNYEDISDSDIVIITAGVPRKPGMSRDDLVQINESIMEDISQQIVRYCPKAFVIVLTNPVDAMTYTVLQSTGFEKPSNGAVRHFRYGKIQNIHSRSITSIRTGYYWACTWRSW